MEMKHFGEFGLYFSPQQIFAIKNDKYEQKNK